MSRIRLYSSENRSLIIVAVIIVLVAVLSFGLGYLFASEHNPAPIIIEKSSEN